MSLYLRCELSPRTKILLFYPSPPTSHFPIAIASSLRLLLRSPKTLALSHITPVQGAISVPTDPIFLHHLNVIEKHQTMEDDNSSKYFQEDGLAKEGDEEVDVDPIRSFFKSRKPVPDPKNEGRMTWQIADIDPVEAELLDEEEQILETNSEVPSAPAEDGIVGEILRIARNLSENSTLGDFLGSFVGKIGECECVDLLVRMGEEEGLVWSCLYLFEWMGLQEPSLVSAKACSVIFTVLGKAGMGKQLMILFMNLPRGKQFRDVRLYNAAISGLSCCKRYDDAWKVFEAMETNNIQPDHATCSILITIMRKSGQCAKDAWNLFERLNKKGVKWSPEGLGSLTKIFCDEGLKKEALIIQSEMEKSGIRPNTIIYNTLMNAYSKSNQVEEAEGLFIEMKKKGLKPSISTYNILMDAYSRRMQPEIVENLLLEIHTSGLKPNVKSYTCLISAYGRCKHMSDKAADSFLRMKAAGIKQTSHSYTALIHAFSIDGWHEKAYAAYQRMTREGIKPSIETYTALLDSFRRAGDTKRLMEIWETMVASKIEGTRVTFNILLDGLAKHGLYAQARNVIHEFGRLGLQPNVLTYNILMNAYARGGQHHRLPKLLKEMAVLELKPDSATFLTIIYAYIRVRDFSQAFKYHKEMVKSGNVPEASSYHKLRFILDKKAATKNKTDRKTIIGVVNSRFGLKRRRGKKDASWKTKKENRSMLRNLSISRREAPRSSVFNAQKDNEF